ncbi:MAG: transcription antitermination factor NusB [Candidatus Aegiribacteria sp.]|nr:transcription antitermination factor NusB [Candidatus Aegiribacteria sp.]
MGVRSRGRKALLQARFAAFINKSPFPENMESMRDFLKDTELGIGVPLEIEDWVWVTDLGRVVQNNREEIDSRIEEAMDNWTLDRLNIVTRLILEQALGEMDYFEPPTPAAVAIDEAIELAKVFDSEEAASFVNGVLDNLI